MCEYCDNRDNRLLKAIKLTYEYEDPKAISYPDVAYWKQEYYIDTCPLCEKKLGE